MRVRFGFVAMALSLENASPSQTMTYKTFQSIPDKEAALRKATQIGRSNLVNTLRILRHAHASGVFVYRFSSKLIPLFTHEATEGWDFIGPLQNEFQQIGEFVQHHGMRVSFHPDHFAVLNSPRPEVFAAAIRDLRYHVAMFEAMKLDETAKLVLHVGGAYGDKQASMTRFVENWSEVPKDIQRRLTLENDDKTYTAKETLSLSDSVNVPMVFDFHHHWCNHEVDDATTSGLATDPGELTHARDFGTLVERFLSSWSSEGIPPKIHMSSPRDEKNFRAHADYVNPAELVTFLDCIREWNVDVDVMLEAKRKDEAVFALMRDLQSYDFIQVLNGGTILYRP